MWKNKSVLWNLPASNFRLGELLEGSAGGKETRREGNSGEGREGGREGEYRLRAGTSLILPKEKIRRKVICGGEKTRRKERVAVKSSLSRFEIQLVKRA